jgi:hypothetical protein
LNPIEIYFSTVQRKTLTDSIRAADSRRPPERTSVSQ